MIRRIKAFVWCVLVVVCAQGSRACEDPDVGRPHEHFCPITCEVMRDPVVALDGYSYEREAISKYLSTNLRSPRTNLPLENRTLIPNVHLKTMIMEWKPGREASPSHFDSQDSKTIAGLVKREFESHADLLHASSRRHIVAFLGNTGAGKSTLVDLLAGKKLISPDGEDYVLENPADPTAMAIGSTGDSETLYPKSIVVGDLLFFDLPGFNDSDGSGRNLVNAAFIRSILIEAASVRAVFVAGQDEFTSQRGASVKELFDGIKRLVVADDGRGDIVNNGLFVVTKSMCAAEKPSVDFLLKKATSATRPLLQEQLQVWAEAGQLSHMKHPRIMSDARMSDDGVQAATRDNLLGLIRGLRPIRVLGVNVSVLYPIEMRGSLTRMFSSVMEEHLGRTLAQPVETLSAIDSMKEEYESQAFWGLFGQSMCDRNPSIGLLKDFCIDQYNEALRSFEREKEVKRQAHIRTLAKWREERVSNLEREAEAKVKESLRDLGPTASASYTDPQEQEIVRYHFSSYLDVLSARLEAQELELSALRPLTGRLDALERDLVALRTAPSRTGEGDGRGGYSVGGGGRSGAAPVARPVLSAIPDIARGHEELYERFIRGKLVYKPNIDGRGMVEVPISSLGNPLDGTFDLSTFGDTSRHLRIHTGYKKCKIAANSDKVEIWVCPHFLGAIAPQFRHIMRQWESPIAYFWTCGSHDVATDNFDYLLKTEFCMNNELNNYEKYAHRSFGYVRGYRPPLILFYFKF